MTNGAAAQEHNKEEAIIGSVGLKVYKSYFGAIENWLFAFTVLFMMAFGQIAISFVDLFIAKWCVAYE